MYISSIEISNFRSFKNLKVNFHNGLNVLIGHNNSGKTNLSQALSLVFDHRTSKQLSVNDFHKYMDLEKLKKSPPKITIIVTLSQSDTEKELGDELAVVSTWCFLVGCQSSNEAVHSSIEQDQDVPETKNLTISEAFEKFPVWYRAEDDADEIARDSNVREVFIFDGDTVTSYLAEHNNFGYVEDFRDLSKEEVIAEVESTATEIEVSISTYDYELVHTLDETGNSVEETHFDNRENRAYLVEQKPIVQMLYDNFIVGF